MGIIEEAKPLQALQLFETAEVAHQACSKIIPQFDTIIKSVVEFHQLANNDQSGSSKR